MDFYRCKMIDSDRSERDLTDETISIWNFPFCWKLAKNKKTAENWRNFNDAEKCIVSKLEKISLPNFDQGCVKI